MFNWIKTYWYCRELQHAPNPSNAIAALVVIGNSAIPKIVSILDSKNKTTVIRAAQLLIELGATDRDPLLGERIARLLGGIGSNESFDVLLNWIRDSHDLNFPVIKSEFKSAGPKTVPVVRSKLTRLGSGANPEYRAALIALLWELPSRDGLTSIWAQLDNSMQNRDGRLQLAVMNAIINLGVPFVDEIISRLEYSLEKERNICDLAVCAELMACIADPDYFAEWHRRGFDRMDWHPKPNYWHSYATNVSRIIAPLLAKRGIAILAKAKELANVPRRPDEHDVRAVALGLSIDRKVPLGECDWDTKSRILIKELDGEVTKCNEIEVTREQCSRLGKLSRTVNSREYEQLENKILEILQTSDYQIAKEIAGTSLAMSGCKQAVPALLELIDCEWAQEAIANHFADVAENSLLMMLADESIALAPKCGAALTLGRNRHPLAVEFFACVWRSSTGTQYSIHRYSGVIQEAVIKFINLLARIEDHRYAIELLLEIATSDRWFKDLRGSPIGPSSHAAATLFELAPNKWVEALLANGVYDDVDWIWRYDLPKIVQSNICKMDLPLLTLLSGLPDQRYNKIVSSPSGEYEDRAEIVIFDMSTVRECAKSEMKIRRSA